MHLFTASLGTETNTFSPIPTGARAFADTYLVRGGAYGEHSEPFALPMREFRDRARARGWRVSESLCAFAVPAGPTVQRVYEGLRDEILADLQRQMPVDVVLLSLHGAMIAEVTQSCETDLVEHIRAIARARHGRCGARLYLGSRCGRTRFRGRRWRPHAHAHRR